MGNYFAGERPDPYLTKADKAPSNCSNQGSITVQENAAVGKAQEYIGTSKQPSRLQNCCTIKGGVVTKWQLPSPCSPTNKVELMSTDSGTVFYYHIDLEVE